jgi:hypothetical protein
VPPTEGCRLPSKPTSSSGFPLALDFNAGDPLPSLDEHYLASTLLRRSPPLDGASVLSTSWFSHLCLFPWHRRPGSQVPYYSSVSCKAFYTPDTAWPVSRFPPHFSRSSGVTPVLMSPEIVSMPRRRFTCARLSHPYLTRSMPRLLTMTFTTTVFGRSSSWRFEAFPCRTAPKGPPSSPVQHDA